MRLVVGRPIGPQPAMALRCQLFSANVSGVVNRGMIYSETGADLRV
jgi:hypothetical protein